MINVSGPAGSQLQTTPVARQTTPIMPPVPLRVFLACLLVLVALALFASLASTAVAGTLGRIDAIERNPNIVIVNGEALRLTAESRLYGSDPALEQPTIITFRSLSAGDYVVVERDGSVIKTLQRIDAQSIDAPASAPVPIRPRSDQ